MIFLSYLFLRFSQSINHQPAIKTGKRVINTPIFYSFSLCLISTFFAGCDSNDRSAKGQPYGSGYLIEDQMPVVGKEDSIDNLTLTDTRNYDVHLEKHENGNLKRQINFSDGKLHNRYTTWFENGQKQTEVSYRLGLRHGASREWYPTGQLKEWVMTRLLRQYRNP